ENYNQIFNNQQRQVIENSGDSETYNIVEGGQMFDISLHTLIAKYMCGLKRNDPLNMNVSKVRDLRNKVCHGIESIDEEELNMKLEELLELYKDILHDLEKHTGDDLQFVVMQIESKINERKKSEINSPMSDWGARDTHYRPPQAMSEPTMPSVQKESEIPTWGKVALGVGAAGLALYGLNKSFSPNEGGRDRKRGQNAHQNNTKEECVIM
ncbi:hypothetical protein SK128_019863, partial [Halocaridina rubra]